MFFLLMLVEKDLVSNVKHLKINLIYVMWEGFLCERNFYRVCKLWHCCENMAAVHDILRNRL